jgi:CheY-like chemotaxis protein
VVVVGDGTQAIAQARQGDFDLVLMDCQMPETDGYEATRAIRDAEREDPAHRRLTIVAVTANASVSDCQRCLDSGMDDFLSKPFREAELAAVLDRHLGPTTQPAAPLAAPQDEAPPAPAIDPAAINRLRAMQRPGRASLLHKIVALYLEHSQSLLAEVQRAIEAEDAQAVAFAAHSLKSESANVGAVGLAQTLQGLEHAGKRGDLADATTLIETATRQYTSACGSLAAILAEAEEPVTMA